MAWKSMREQSPCESHQRGIRLQKGIIHGGIFIDRVKGERRMSFVDKAIAQQLG